MHPAILACPPTLYVMFSPRLTHGPMMVNRATSYGTHVYDVAGWAERQLKRMGNPSPIADMERHQVLRQWAARILARDCPDLPEWLEANPR